MVSLYWTDGSLVAHQVSAGGCGEPLAQCQAIRMIIAFSILAGILAAWVAYRILFYDAGDFWEGFDKFITGLGRRGNWKWPRNDPPPTPEQFEDESWSSGIRFFLFVAVSFGSGYFAYYQLHKHFG